MLSFDIQPVSLSFHSHHHLQPPTFYGQPNIQLVFNVDPFGKKKSVLKLLTPRVMVFFYVCFFNKMREREKEKRERRKNTKFMNPTHSFISKKKCIYLEKE